MEAHRDVITRFGGIREMARKLEHANHTTVQGWWERSRIPMDRWAEIDAAAKKEGVEFEMSELMPPSTPTPDEPQAEAA